MGQIKNIKLHIVTDIKEILSQSLNLSISQFDPTMEDLGIIGTKRPAAYFTPGYYGQDMGYNTTTEDMPKKNRSEDSVIRLLLLGQDCGAIVGRGGENLSRLRKEFNVDVQMPSGRTMDRVFMIIGHMDCCLGVVEDTLQHSKRGPFPVGPPSEMEINLLVESDLVGHILGKSGAKIKEIREQSNAKIKVYQECMPNSNERVVAIGCENPEQMGKCVRLIYEVLQNVERKSPPCYYEPGNTGGLGTNGAYGQPAYGQQQQQQQQQQRSGNMNMNMNSDNGFAGNEFLNAMTETKITVSNDMCGAIIGRGGMNIREIRNSSGAQITFSGELDSRVISVVGTQRQVQQAEQMLTQSCANRMAK